MGLEERLKDLGVLVANLVAKSKQGALVAQCAHWTSMGSWGVLKRV